MSDRYKEINKKLEKRAILVLIVGGIALVILPIIFTRTFDISFFKDTGTLGDTIGGITAPITGLIGSLLVYWALKAQIEANNLVFDQFKSQKQNEAYRKLMEYISTQIDYIRTDINEIAYKSTRTTTTTSSNGGSPKEKSRTIEGSGTAAISLTLYDAGTMRQSHNDAKAIYNDIPNLTLIKLLLERIDKLLDNIYSYEIGETDQKYLGDAVKYTYLTKLQPFLKKYEQKRMSLSSPCKDCKQKHIGIPEDIYEIYDLINKKHFPHSTRKGDYVKTKIP
jgi:hypothetical protein